MRKKYVIETNFRARTHTLSEHIRAHGSDAMDHIGLLFSLFCLSARFYCQQQWNSRKEREKSTTIAAATDKNTATVVWNFSIISI